MAHPRSVGFLAVEYQALYILASGAWSINLPRLHCARATAYKEIGIITPVFATNPPRTCYVPGTRYKGKKYSPSNSVQYFEKRWTVEGDRTNKHSSSRQSLGQDRMPSSDIATSVVDSIDAAVVSPAAGGAPPPSESARQDDKGDKEGARILFRDEEEFRRKRERMVADGAHQLQVIAGI